MLFPSNIFLFCFFPMMLFLYYVVGNCRLFTGRIIFKNVILLVGSLIFYAYGEKWLVLLLVASILFNYGMGLLVEPEGKKGAGASGSKPDGVEESGSLERGPETKKSDAAGEKFFGSRLDGVARRPAVKTSSQRFFMAVAVIVNLAVLFIYKYLDFVIANVNRIAGCSIALTGLKLPIGISFFTFQALSYVIDVCRGKAKAQRNPLYVGLYISLFPQLIAGPIVRYESIAQQMLVREENVPKFTEGIERFIKGLGKKVLLADGMALFADRIFNNVSAGGSVSTAMAWLGALCYTLQIYYDFSGYSDMAIGLGKMFGFTFEENFDHPYAAGSVTQFWRRWHISLSSWFRDYVYIPLGGNRKGAGRMYLNLLAVWTLTGIWHGAGWTFVLWGLMYFCVLAFEKATGMGKKWSLPPGLSSLYTMLVVVAGWTVFRSPSLGQALAYLKMMLGIGAAGALDDTVLFYLKDNWLLFLAAVIFVMPTGKVFKKCSWLYQVFLGGIFLVSLVYIWKGGYSPFIYFSF